MLSDLLLLNGIPSLFEWTPNFCKLRRQNEVDDFYSDLDRASRTQLVPMPGRSLSTSFRMNLCGNTSSRPAYPNVMVVQELGFASKFRPESVIVIIRTNHVKAALSRMRLWANHRTTNTTVRPMKYTVNTQTLACYISPKMHPPSTIVSLPHVLVTYEQLQLRPVHTLRRIASAIPGLHLNGSIRTSIPLVKSASEDLRDVIRNYKEVSKWLSPWPCLFDMFVTTHIKEYNMNACAYEIGRATRTCNRSVKRRGSVH